MEKPRTMPVKDFIIRKLAVKLMINEDVVEKIIVHNYSYLHKNLKEVNSIEFSGFGKLFFNRKKALGKIYALEQMIERCNSQLITAASEEESRYYRRMIGNAITDLEYLKYKTNEQQAGTDKGRVEKLPTPS